jgi:hypothetical protein
VEDLTSTHYSGIPSCQGQFFFHTPLCLPHTVLDPGEEEGKVDLVPPSIRLASPHPGWKNRCNSKYVNNERSSTSCPETILCHRAPQICNVELLSIWTALDLLPFLRHAWPLLHLLYEPCFRWGLSSLLSFHTGSWSVPEKFMLQEILGHGPNKANQNQFLDLLAPGERSHLFLPGVPGCHSSVVRVGDNNASLQREAMFKKDKKKGSTHECCRLRWSPLGLAAEISSWISKLV